MFTVPPAATAVAEPKVNMPLRISTVLPLATPPTVRTVVPVVPVMLKVRAALLGTVAAAERVRVVPLIAVIVVPAAMPMPVMYWPTNMPVVLLTVRAVLAVEEAAAAVLPATAGTPVRVMRLVEPLVAEKPLTVRMPVLVKFHNCGV